MTDAEFWDSNVTEIELRLEVESDRREWLRYVITAAGWLAGMMPLWKKPPKLKDLLPPKGKKSADPKAERRRRLKEEDDAVARMNRLAQKLGVPEAK